MPLTRSLSLTTAKRRIALSVVTGARTKKAVVEGKGPGTGALVARLAATQPVRRNSFMSQIRAHEEKEEGIMYAPSISMSYNFFALLCYIQKGIKHNKIIHIILTSFSLLCFCTQGVR